MCYNLSTDWRLWSRASHNHETLHLAQSSTERRVRCNFSLKSVVLRSETTKKTCYFFYVISWPSLPTKDPLMTVRNTIFFRTVELAYNQGDVAHFHEEFCFFIHLFIDYWEVCLVMYMPRRCGYLDWLGSGSKGLGSRSGLVIVFLFIVVDVIIVFAV